MGSGSHQASSGIRADLEHVIPLGAALDPDHAELAAFKAAHPEVEVVRSEDFASGAEVWYADHEDWRTCGYTLPEFLRKLHRRFAPDTGPD